MPWAERDLVNVSQNTDICITSLPGKWEQWFLKSQKLSFIKNLVGINISIKFKS